MPHAIGIVAHHDDHALWMGGAIQRLAAAGWKWTLVALCVPDKNRREYFYHCCSAFGAVPVAFDFLDYRREEPFSRNSRSDMQEALEKVIGDSRFDLVFTHSRNPMGEYRRRHANHIEVREVTTDLVDSGRLGCGRSSLAYFCYDSIYGNSNASCAALYATYYLPLSYSELLWKAKLCSLAPDVETNLNALKFPCPNPEGFEGDKLILPDMFAESGRAAENHYSGSFSRKLSCVLAPAKPAQREQVVFLLENLRGIGNGVEESSIKRAHLFHEYLGITPWMITSNFNPSLADYVAIIKEKGALPNEVEVLNVYDLITEMWLTGLIKRLEPMPCNEYSNLKLVITGDSLGLQKYAYVEAEDRSKVWREEFVADGRHVLVRKSYKRGSDKPVLTSIQLRAGSGNVLEFSNESAFVCHIVANNLDVRTVWHFVIDKNEMYRTFTKTPGLQRLKRTVTAVLHSHHLRLNGQQKFCYRHLLQDDSCYDMLVTLTQEQYKDLLGLGLAQDRMRVIPHPLPGKITVPSGTRAGIGKRVIYLARYAPEKRHDVLLRVFRRVLEHIPDAELHTYGTGSLKQTLVDQVSELGLQDRIKIHGFVDDVALAFNSASLGVMTSQEEGFSLFGFECLSYGCPLVAFAVQYGLRDLLEGQDAGILVEPGNEEAMAQALIDLLQHPDKIEVMRANAIRSASRFQMDNVLKEWRAWWHDIQAIAGQAIQGKHE